MEHEMGWSVGVGSDLADSKIGTPARRWTAVANEPLSTSLGGGNCSLGWKKAPPNIRRQYQSVSGPG